MPERRPVLNSREAHLNSGRMFTMLVDEIGIESWANEICGYADALSFRSGHEYFELEHSTVSCVFYEFADLLWQILKDSRADRMQIYSKPGFVREIVLLNSEYINEFMSAFGPPAEREFCRFVDEFEASVGDKAPLILVATLLELDRALSLDVLVSDMPSLIECAAAALLRIGSVRLAATLIDYLLTMEELHPSQTSGTDAYAVDYSGSVYLLSYVTAMKSRSDLKRVMRKENLDKFEFSVAKRWNDLLSQLRHRWWRS